MRKLLHYFKLFLITACMCLLYGNAYAQQPQLDSIQKSLVENKNEDDRILNLLNAIVPYQVNIKPNDALANADNAIELARKLNNKKQLAIAYSNKEFVLLGKSEFEQAKQYFRKSLDKPTNLGAGLGLSISYDIVKSHNGTLFLESSSDAGTTFVLSIPN